MKIRVHIATTQGPSLVQHLRIDDPMVGLSVICLNRIARALPISSAYAAFVERGIGVINRDFGDAVFRMDVSDPIDEGSSWNLGVYLAHALFAEDALMQLDDELAAAPDVEVLATGIMDIDLRVRPVDDLVDKMSTARPLIEACVGAGTPLIVLVPSGQGRDALPSSVRAELPEDGEGFRILEVDQLQPRAPGLLAALGLGERTPSETAEREPSPGRRMAGPTSLPPDPPVNGGMRRYILAAGVFAVGLAAMCIDIFTRVDPVAAGQSLIAGDTVAIVEDLAPLMESDCFTCLLYRPIALTALRSAHEPAPPPSIAVTPFHGEGSCERAEPAGEARLLLPHDALAHDVADPALCWLQVQITNTGPLPVVVGARLVSEDGRQLAGETASLAPNEMLAFFVRPEDSAGSVDLINGRLTLSTLAVLQSDSRRTLRTQGWLASLDLAAPGHGRPMDHLLQALVTRTDHLLDVGTWHAPQPLEAPTAPDAADTGSETPAPSDGGDDGSARSPATSASGTSDGTRVPTFGAKPPRRFPEGTFQ